MRWTPRLRTVLFTVNLVILLVPVGGIVLLRLYESALVRRTEAELVAQGAHVAGAYLVSVRRELERQEEAPAPGEYGGEVLPGLLPEQGPFRPLLAELDLAINEVRPAPEDGREPSEPPDPVAVAAGEHITDGMRAAQKVTLAGIRVVDYRGTVVATTRSEGGKSLAHREEVSRALRGQPVSVMRQRVSDEPPPALNSLSRSTKIRVFVCMPVVENDRVWGAVLLSRTPMNVGKSLYYIRWHILAGALGLLFVVGLLSLMTSWTITGPMEDLIRQTERVARGEEGEATTIARPGTHEIRQVSEAIARMARTLEERSEYIRTFASSVSHEFKTPLSGIRGAVELLRDHLEEMSDEERNRFLDNLDQDAERLSRLVGRLADLARADVVKPTEETTEVTRVVDELVTRYLGDDLELTADTGELPIEIQMAREPLESILTNLIDNARQHGGADVSITVTTRLEDRDGEAQAVLEVLDDGPGISEANQKRIFDRFFTTARDRGGSGLGLSIVQSLVDVHGGSIELDSKPGETRFAAVLPAGVPDTDRRSRPPRSDG